MSEQLSTKAGWMRTVWRISIVASCLLPAGFILSLAAFRSLWKLWLFVVLILSPPAFPIIIAGFVMTVRERFAPRNVWLLVLQATGILLTGFSLFFWMKVALFHGPLG